MSNATMAAAIAAAALGGATVLFAQQAVVIDHPMLVYSGNGESGLPLQPQVAQILSSVNNGPPAEQWKRAEAAEDKLVALGAGSGEELQRQIASVRGPERDVLIVAAFRLENAPLAPRQSIGDWATRKSGVDPATLILRHFSTEDLRRLLPHHLFYVVEKKANAAGKDGFPRTLVALAADGKVQSLNDDADLAHFLKVELPEGADKVKQRRVAALAAELALVREGLPTGAIVSDAQWADGGATGTARGAAAHGASVSVHVTFSPDARVTQLVTTVNAPTKDAVAAPAEEPATAQAPATAEAPATAASTNAATAPGRVHLIRRLHPIFRGGPQPLDSDK